ncbi:D-Tyr tRNAtyr deacylase-like domain-containing protein [Limtongia smithiae]|uniref:D-Tyr tRNAtyr deacylase-like domain-containing protein n=1 Tax=Limtongia smithiae TaxID=1125753 RepID=UPI0034CF31E2
MRAIVQRVRSASVSVNDQVISAISRGILVLLGVEAGDTTQDADTLAARIVNLKIFPAPAGTAVSAPSSTASSASASTASLVSSGEAFPNTDESARLDKQWDKSVAAIGGEVLCISQFTLLASVKKNKPSFHHAERPAAASELYEYTMTQMRKIMLADDKVKPGVFGAYMQVALVNDGPVTIELNTK